MSKSTDLSKFDNSWYRPGSVIKRVLWYFVSNLFFINRLFPFVAPKRALLSLFGARVGKGVIIKPKVNIKYPWMLTIGDHAWIGEEVWIDNLAQVTIGSHACLSQGAMLLCGNHDYKKEAFDLIINPITVEEGAWIGARATVVGGVTASSHAVLSVGSVATSNLDPYSIYQGVPATKLRERVID